MNRQFEQEIHYKLLKLLVSESNLSQREMATRMGISLGKTNYVLKALADKGLVKVKRFKSARNKIPYTYMLTPRGLEEKAKITMKFLKRKLAEYEEIMGQIKEIASDLQADPHVDFEKSGLLKKYEKIEDAGKRLLPDLQNF